jgi:hypothetical protein
LKFSPFQVMSGLTKSTNSMIVCQSSQSPGVISILIFLVSMIVAPRLSIKLTFSDFIRRTTIPFIVMKN